MSDLHLEAQDFPWALPQGDVLIVAGDLCHAYCFTAPPSDLYAARQRERVRRFADEAVAKFAHVLMIAGNHEHYDGVFEDTVPALRQHLPGFTVLDDNHVDIGAVRFFGATLWAGFDGGDPAAMETARRGVGASRPGLDREVQRAVGGEALDIGVSQTQGARARRRR
jgi:3',5'-cyclic AMP phosphodiesterase CpdA